MRFLFCILFIVFAGSVFAQRITFERITTKDGLSQNDILAIYQDSEGYMWFGTNDGLNRYDGYEFEVFRESNTGEPAIGSSLISDINEDSDNNLWVSTLNAGITIYNPREKSYKYLQNTKENSNYLLDNYIRTVNILDDGTIWAGGRFGMHIINKKEDNSYHVIKLNHEETSPLALEEKYINWMIPYQDSLAWIVANYKFYLLRKDKDNVTGYSIKHTYNIPGVWDMRYIKECPYGVLITSSEGLYLLTVDSKNPENYTLKKLTNLNSQLIQIDQEGNLWTGGISGLQLLSLTEDPKMPYKLVKTFTDGPNDEHLSNKYIRSLFIDKSGIVWIGTNGGGICKYTPNKHRFRTYKSSSTPGSISNNKVSEIYEDSEKNVWFGTEGDGLNFLPYKNNKRYNDGFTKYDVNPVNQQNFVYDILDVSTRQRKEFLVGIGYGGLLKKIVEDPINGWKVTAPPFQPSTATMVLKKDSFGNVWAGTYLAGLYRYNPDREPNHQQYILTNSGIPSDIIRSLLFDRKGRLWIGTGEGLCVIKKSELNKPTPRFKVFKRNKKDTSSISHNYILPVFESSDGTIWIGTLGGGVNRYVEGSELDNGTFVRITTDDGLSNNVIKDFVEDRNGNLWISSNSGLSMFDPKSGKIWNYDKSDGLQDMEFADLSGCILHDGEILFGGINGFNAFYPEEITVDTVPPLIVFNKLQIADKFIEVGEEVNGNVLLSRSINDTELLILGHEENNFSIYFAGIHYSSPKNNQYKYRLNGFDKDWIKTNTNQRFAKYTNLDAGEYIFEVMASNSDGVWAKESKKLRIKITPAYWETWWFRIIAVLLIVAFALLYFFKRISDVKKRNQELEKEIKKRTSEVTNQNEILTQQTAELNTKNTKLEQQTLELNETNTQLEERQQVIEEQSQELLSKKMALEEMNATKDKFFSILAHDLKSPFNTLLGFLGLLNKKMDKLSEEKKRDYIKMITDSANHLYKLMQNLLEWSRAQRGTIPFNPELQNAQLLIESDFQLLESTAIAKGLTMSFDITPANLKVFVDAHMFSTIFRNITNNAIKYTNRGGEIKIIASQKNSKVLFEISDNGVGIPQEVICNLFKIGSHYTTPGTEHEAGTGLGLILCHEFVKKNKGDIWVKSEEGKGSSFYFSFPVK